MGSIVVSNTFKSASKPQITIIMTEQLDVNIINYYYCFVAKRN